MSHQDICIDYRENELLSYFQPRQQETPFIKASKYCPNVQNLQVGDIIIGTDASGNPLQGSLVVERKTIQDFEASFLDGRYRDQRTRLLTFCKEKQTNVAYILEGEPGKQSRLPGNTLKKLVTRLQLHYKIPVFQTKNSEDTANLVVSWIEQWQENRQSFSLRTEEITLAENIHVSKKTNSGDPRVFMIGCLSNCQGISVKMAEQIAEKWKSWEGLLAASADDIINIKMENGRRIGPVVGERLHSILHSTW
jgi:ERCC4-type nuclease